jgi:hypothetical protein
MLGGVASVVGVVPVVGVAVAVGALVGAVEVVVGVLVGSVAVVVGALAGAVAVRGVARVIARVGLCCESAVIWGDCVCPLGVAPSVGALFCGRCARGSECRAANALSSSGLACAASVAGSRARSWRVLLGAL